MAPLINRFPAPYSTLKLRFGKVGEIFWVSCFWSVFFSCEMSASIISHRWRRRRRTIVVVPSSVIEDPGLHICNRSNRYSQIPMKTDNQWYSEIDECMCRLLNHKIGGSGGGGVIWSKEWKGSVAGAQMKFKDKRPYTSQEGQCCGCYPRIGQQGLI
ncbi:unnamed protein product [Lactuca saligna]|uniref:Uncharacterized protein n=1 Tax=Lactuca saligna TaxID=75948 RepID=A0AA35YX63_LACSI|nr:unnamed protein product [Lactuca saligna]